MADLDTKKQNLKAIVIKWKKNNPNHQNTVIDAYCNNINDALASATEDELDKLLAQDLIADYNFTEIKKLRIAIRFWQEEKIQSSKGKAEGIDHHIERLEARIKAIGENFLVSQQPTDVQLVETALNRNHEDIKSLKSLYAFWLVQPQTEQIKTHLKNIYILIKELENSIPDILISSKDNAEGTWKTGYDAVRQNMAVLKNEDLKLKLQIPKNNQEHLKISAEKNKEENSSHAFPLAKSRDRRKEPRADDFATSDKNYENELFRSKSGKRTVFYNGQVVNSLQELRAAVAEDRKQDFEEALCYSHVIMQDPAGPYINYSMAPSEKSAAPQTSNIYFLETSEGFLFESISEDYQYTGNDQQSHVIPGNATAIFEYKKSDPGFTWKSLHTSNALLDRLVNGKEDSSWISEKNIQEAKQQEEDIQNDYKLGMIHLKRLVDSLPQNAAARPIINWLYEKIDTLATKHASVADYELLTRVADRIIELTTPLLQEQVALKPAPASGPLATNHVLAENKHYQDLKRDVNLLVEVHNHYDDRSLTVALVILLVLAGVGLSITGVGAIFGLGFFEIAFEIAVSLALSSILPFSFSRLIYKDMKDSIGEAEEALRNPVSGTIKPLLVSLHRDREVTDINGNLQQIAGQVVSEKEPVGFKETNSDNERSLTAEFMHQLFDANFRKCAQVANKTPTFYQKNNRLLISAVAAKESSEVGAEPSLQKALTSALKNKPTEIIVPVIEEKSGLASVFSETRHIKTLHIKDIQYNESGNVSSYSVDYYDSKPSVNNHAFPSDNVKKIVEGALKCSCNKDNWKPKNPEDNQPQQPSSNSSDCGYWAYVWSSALFNRTEEFDITHYFPNENENEMKLIHIARLITEQNDPKPGPKQDFINKAKELFELIIKKTDNDPEKAAAINVLYGEMKQVNKESENSYQVTDQDDFAVVDEDKAATASIYNTELIQKTIDGLRSENVMKLK